MRNIELFADTILLLSLTVVAIVLLQVDPLLPILWTGATAVMTLRH